MPCLAVTRMHLLYLYAQNEQSGAVACLPPMRGICTLCRRALTDALTCRQSTAALSQAVGQMAVTDAGPHGATAHTQPNAGDNDEHDKNISKSQAKRLRKKKREGKV